MPRGIRKRGAWDCHLWFADGSSYRLTSLPDRTFTDAEMAASIRKNLLPMLDAVEKKKPKVKAASPSPSTGEQ